jgi:hypothetical protein
LLTGHDDEKYLINKYLRNIEFVEAIAIGTSHAWAINFKSLEIEGIGLGLGGRDLTECKYILEFLLSPKNNHIKKVFISISYFSLYQDNTSTDKSLSDARTFMYNTIPSWKMIEGDYRNYIIGKFLPFIQSDHWQGIVIKYIRKIKSGIHDKTNEKIAVKIKSPTNMNKEIPIKEIEVRVFSQHRLHERSKKNKIYNVKEYNLNILKDIIKMLKANGVEPILFTPPYYYKYNELYNDTYIKERKNEMKHIVEDFNIKYLDYSMDSDFIYDSRFFHDADHINLQTSKIFSHKIKQFM